MAPCQKLAGTIAASPEPETLVEGPAFWKEAVGYEVDLWVKATLLERDPASVPISRSPVPLRGLVAISTAPSVRMATPGVLRQGAWALVLSRYSGDDDVVFGTIVSGRSVPLRGVESMVGLFINILPTH